jgi:hypothetical protein
MERWTRDGNGNSRCCGELQMVEDSRCSCEDSRSRLSSGRSPVGFTSKGLRLRSRRKSRPKTSTAASAAQVFGGAALRRCEKGRKIMPAFAAEASSACGRGGLPAALDSLCLERTRPGRRAEGSQIAKLLDYPITKSQTFLVRSLHLVLHAVRQLLNFLGLLQHVER